MTPSDAPGLHHDPKIDLDLQAPIEERLRAWRDDFDLQTNVDAWLFRQLVAYSLQAERAQADERDFLQDHAHRARNQWDDARRLDASNLGARLARHPESTRLRLRQTRQGCDWLLARWNALAEILGRGETWNDAQRRLALDLAGTPAEVRTPDNHIPSPSTLVLREIDALTVLRDGPLAQHDANARDAALQGRPLEIPRALLAIRRREATFLRLFENTRKLLLARAADRPPESPYFPSLPGFPRSNAPFHHSTSPPPPTTPTPTPTPTPPSAPTNTPHTPTSSIRLSGSLLGTNPTPNRQARRAARHR